MTKTVPWTAVVGIAAVLDVDLNKTQEINFNRDYVVIITVVPDSQGNPTLHEEIRLIERPTTATETAVMVNYTCPSECAATHPGREHETIAAQTLRAAADALEKHPPMLRVQYVAALRLYAAEPWRLE